MYKNVNMSFSVTNSIKKENWKRGKKKSSRTLVSEGSFWWMLLRHKKRWKKTKKKKHRPTARYVCVNKTGNF